MRHTAFLAVLVACLSWVTCDKQTSPRVLEIFAPTPVATPVVTAVTVSPGIATMSLGERLTFVAAVTAEPGATDRSVTWTSSDPMVAAVDSNGVVTAVSEGRATIRATARSNTAVSAAAEVTVLAPAPPSPTVFNGTYAGSGSASPNGCNFTTPTEAIATLNVNAAGTGTLDLTHLRVSRSFGNTITLRTAAAGQPATFNVSSNAAIGGTDFVVQLSGSVTSNTMTVIHTFNNSLCETRYLFMLVR